jgi:hypothetical protein
MVISSFCRLPIELRERAVTLGFGLLDLAACNEGTRALLRVDDTADLHFAIGAQDGVGIDGEIDGYLADGGQLVAACQRAGGDAGLHLVDDLAEDGDTAVGVETEGESFGLFRRRHLDK